MALSSHELAPAPSTTNVQADTNPNVLASLISSPVHAKYDDELVCMMVESRIYRVSRKLLAPSPPLSNLIDSSPCGEVIPMTGVRVFEVESLLEVLHARQIEPLLQLTVDQWASALHLATKWSFAAVRTYIIKRLGAEYKDQDALDRFELAIKCQVSQWLPSIYNTLCTRDDPLNAEEGTRLGYQRLTAICRIRELYREAKRGAGCSLSCTDCSLNAALLCAPSDAMRWITEAKELQMVFPEVAEEGITEIDSRTETALKQTSEVSLTKDDTSQASISKEERQEVAIVPAPNPTPDAVVDNHDLPKERDHQVIDLADPAPQVSIENCQMEPSTPDDSITPRKSVPAPADSSPVSEVEDAHPCLSCEASMTRTVSTVRLKIGRSNKPENFKTRTVVSWVCEPCQKREQSAAQVQAVEADTGSEPPIASEVSQGAEAPMTVSTDSPIALRVEDAVNLPEVLTTSEETVRTPHVRTPSQSIQQDRRLPLAKARSDSTSSDGREYSFVSAGGLSDAVKSLAGSWFDRVGAIPARQGARS